MLFHSKTSFLVFILLLNVFGCGGDRHDPVPGDYVVRSTLLQVNGDCGSSAKEVGEETTDIWRIEEEDGVYRLLPLDDDGNVALIFSTSNDGYTFGERVDGPIIGDCAWHIVWETSVEYTDETISGTHTNTLTISCVEGLCQEVWHISGTLKDD